ncbi:sensor histidine kinase [Alkalicoccus daliensis]|uniref:histidine kinase n=1 Tax=Alkalicoccus daliensis TaxID=745820 RepID=A0A1H0J457_9BACI|nr:sensor histidine kinase [Alkalicoccus daliensis]SDO38558.1 two-component system, NtrC family, sensor histidine kinase AtoS [Alkalicoccus daliensis]
MNERIRKWSLRSKIFIVLLLLTALLSSLSFFFINSLGEMNEVSEVITEDNVPELIWLSHWDSQLMMKEELMEVGIETAFCCAFVQRYEMFREDARTSMEEVYGAPPASLETLEREMEMLDFLILNQVNGLINLNNIESAEAFILTEYETDLNALRAGIEAERQGVTAALDDHQDRFEGIIAEALQLLVLATAGIILIALIISYKISASFSRPVEKMGDQLQFIAAGNYGAAVEESDQLELAPLTRSINLMSFELKRSFDLLVLDKMYREQILDSLPIGIVTSDEERGEISLNKTARDIMGEDFRKTQIPHRQEEAAGTRRFWEVLTSEEIFQNEKVKYEDGNEEYTYLCSQSLLVNESQETIGKVFYFIDITETENLEQQVRKTEKLAVIGELAAGAAHEIRNPLAVIDGFLGLMKQSLKKEDREKFHLSLLLKEIERINGIIEDMLLLAKPGAPRFKMVSLDKIVEEILPLFEETLEMQDISFHVALEPQPLWVDERQIKQIFHNLIRNSSEAMNKKGSISIFGERKKYIYCVEFIDDGPGIKPEEKTRLFDPFRTTKKTGTGLGLPIAEQMMENHSGTIYLHKSSEKGTIFRMEFPLPVEEE